MKSRKFEKSKKSFPKKSIFEFSNFIKKTLSFQLFIKRKLSQSVLKCHTVKVVKQFQFGHLKNCSKTTFAICHLRNRWPCTLIFLAYIRFLEPLIWVTIKVRSDLEPTRGFKPTLQLLTENIEYKATALPTLPL